MYQDSKINGGALEREKRAEAPPRFWRVLELPAVTRGRPGSRFEECKDETMWDSDQFAEYLREWRTSPEWPAELRDWPLEPSAEQGKIKAPGTRENEGVWDKGKSRPRRLRAKRSERCLAVAPCSGAWS